MTKRPLGGRWVAVGGCWRDAGGPIAAGGSAVRRRMGSPCTYLLACLPYLLYFPSYEPVAAQGRLGWGDSYLNDT